MIVIANLFVDTLILIAFLITFEPPQTGIAIHASLNLAKAA